MAKYIDAEKVIAALTDTLQYDGLVMDELISVVANIPAADVVERKTGKWYKPNGVMPPEHFGRHRCSICDAFAMHDWKHHREQLTDYCPNCGADMRGDKHETD